jgi:hypothetical protein
MDLFYSRVMDLFAHSTERHMSQMTELRSTMQAITVQADQRLRDMQTTITTRLDQADARNEARAQQQEARLQALEQNVGAAASSAAAYNPSLHLVAHEPKTRMLIEFLARHGMSTNTGIVTAFPVILNSTLRIVICVPLLKIAMMAMFKRKMEGCSMTTQTKYHSFLFSAMQQFLVDVERDEIMEAIMPVFPFRLYNDGRCNPKDWLVVDVDFFLAAVDHVTRNAASTLRQPETPAHEVEWKGGKGKSQPMYDKSSRTSPKPDTKSKLAWGCDTVYEALDTPAVAQYLAKLGRTTPCHFSGVTPRPELMMRHHYQVCPAPSPVAAASAAAAAKSKKRTRAPAKRGGAKRGGARAAPSSDDSSAQGGSSSEAESDSEPVKRVHVSSEAEEEDDEIVTQ